MDMEGREHREDGTRQKQDGGGGGATTEAAETMEEVDNGMSCGFRSVTSLESWKITGVAIKRRRWEERLEKKVEVLVIYALKFSDI